MKTFYSLGGLHNIFWQIQMRPLEVFCKKGVFFQKISLNSQEKSSWETLLQAGLQRCEKDTPTELFSCKFDEIFKDNLKENLRAAASSHWKVSLSKIWTSRVKTSFQWHVRTKNQSRSLKLKKTSRWFHIRLKFFEVDQMSTRNYWGHNG